MTLARTSLRCRAYASSDSGLSRVIMPLFYESGLDLREGERHLAACRHRHAQLAGDLRHREDAAHHRALHHQRMLAAGAAQHLLEDRKSTRLNSSHSQISYAVFCLKKKKKESTKFSTVISSELAQHYRVS